MIVMGTESLLDLLNSSEIKFYLTGSRYFGPVTLAADWDFFVQNSSQVLHYLEFHSFKILSETNYKDCSTISVYRRNNVDVQVVADVNAKILAQKLIRQYRLLSMARDKGEGRRIWDFALNLIMEKQNAD